MTKNKHPIDIQIWSWVTTIMIIVPLLSLGWHYHQDRRLQVYCQAIHSDSSEPVADSICGSFRKHNTNLGYRDREWQRVVITEIILIFSFCLKLILRKKANYFNRN